MKKPPRSQVMHRGGGSNNLDEDPLQFLWAVSYSDLLMVLLCFFVVYFNFSDAFKESAVERIVNVLNEKYTKPTVGLGLAGQPAKGKNSGFLNGENIFAGDREGDASSGKCGGALSGGLEECGPTAKGKAQVSIEVGSGGATRRVAATGLSGGGVGANGSAGVAGINSQLNVFKDSTQVQQDIRGVLIDFPDNMFKMGQYSLTKKMQEEITKVLDVVKLHKDDVMVTFIGHTDEIPVKSAGGSVIDTNFVLSNLRAAKAVEFAVETGFDPRWVTAQGVGEHLRMTRSLSLRISERKSRW